MICRYEKARSSRLSRMVSAGDSCYAKDAHAFVPFSHLCILSYLCLPQCLMNGSSVETQLDPKGSCHRPTFRCSKRNDDNARNLLQCSLFFQDLRVPQLVSVAYRLPLPLLLRFRFRVLCCRFPRRRPRQIRQHDLRSDGSLQTRLARVNYELVNLRRVRRRRPPSSKRRPTHGPRATLGSTARSSVPATFTHTPRESQVAFNVTLWQ